MINFRFSVFILTLGLSLCLNAQSSFKVMFYNLLNYPTETTFPERDTDLEAILSDYQPDLFLVCELNNEAGANNILSITQNTIRPEYAMANFVTNSSDDLTGDNNELQNMLYYDSAKFILESQTEITTLVRDFNHYKLKLNTVNQEFDPIILDVIVCHLKAATGPSNENIRFQMVQDLVAYLDTLPEDSHIILGGDLNLYSAFESAFQELLDVSNYITFADPANRVGVWSNNPDFLDVFTQSTRTTSNLGGAAGGFDDRFDFILTSENMLNNADLYYVENSYQVFGNNNNPDCYNRAINSGDCSGSEFSLTMRQSLHNFSDHLPVTLTLETPQLLSVSEIHQKTAFSLYKTLILNGIIQVQHENIAVKEFKIINQLGQVIHTFSANTSGNTTENLNFLTSGVYALMVPSAANKLIKFILAH